MRKPNRREGEEYLRMVLAESGATRVVGEKTSARCRDMCDQACDSLGIAGFKIPQWEFLHGQMTPGSQLEAVIGHDLRDA